MKNSLLAALVFGASALIAVAKQPPSYELTKFSRKNKADAPIISGFIDQPSSNGQRRRMEVAVIAVDGVTANSDATGHYVRTLQPGRHRLLAGFIGFLPVRIKDLRLGQGDSIRIDFHLQYDMRPTTN